MTTELNFDLSQLPTGDRLNEAIAEWVMQYPKTFDSILGEMWEVSESGETVETPSFATQPDLAGEVIEKVRHRGLEPRFMQALCMILGVDNMPANLGELLMHHQPSPEQICQAALMSVKSD